MTPSEQLADIAKVTPPITVTGMTLAGYPLSQWVLLLTAIYTVIQIYSAVRRLYQSHKAGKPSGCAIDNCPARKP